MPLLKLWNSLFGRPTEAKQPEARQPEATKQELVLQAVAVTKVAKEASPPEASPAQMKKATKTAKKTREGAPTVRLAPLAVVDTPAPITPARQFKVVTRGEHAEICRLVVEALPTSVLEMGVGDGLRAEAVMQSLLAVSAGKTLRYAAIDQFEMVGGPIKLKDFHLRMRAIDVRPQVFPAPVAQGLSRFSSTVGFADIVISSIPEEEWNSGVIQSLITRITRPSSVVLHLSEGRWKRKLVNHSQSSKASNAA